MRLRIWFVVMLSSALAAGDARAALKIKTLSNRADLVSGGDVLLRVSGAPAKQLRVRLNGRNVTKRLRPGRRARTGLVRGLRLGRNTVRVSARGKRPARLRVVNHPLGGPVIAGPQVQPWTCRNEEFGLGAPRDAQCTTDPVVRYEYKNAVTQMMAAYDPDAPPPPEQIATTTTDEGREVPFVVRIEKGVIDRNTYQLKVLDGNWNRKLYWTFGGDCTPRHDMTDANSPSAMTTHGEEVIGLGYISAMAANTNLGSRCDSVVNAETVLMLKEHITETYGRISRTTSEGCSGGSMQQNWISSNYPGLLDAIQVQCTYTDIWNTMQQATDCHLLDRVFDRDLARWDPAKQAAVAGYQAVTTCRSLWDGPGILETPAPGFYSRNWLDPDNGVGCLGGAFGATGEDPSVLLVGTLREQPEYVYDAETNRDGVRCTLQDYMKSIFGLRPDGFANRPYDNVGVQYGLRSLREGKISPDDFVTLNERVGGLDIDWNKTPERSVADRAALRVAYRAGLVTNPRQQAKIPVFDMRGSSNLEIHTDVNSYILRARQDAASGHHDNSFIYTSATPLKGDKIANDESFSLLNRWLDAIEADTGRGTKEQKVIRNKPAEAVDACFIRGEKVTDLDRCRAQFPVYADPRLVAGGPLTDDVLKCRLRPLEREEYAGTGMTDAQFERLRAAFPGGVCDYSRPGVAQQPSVPWMTFKGGPGGKPLGRAPRSTLIKQR